MNASLPDATARMALFKNHRRMESSKIDTHQLSSGSASLYVAPKDMELRLQMPCPPLLAPDGVRKHVAPLEPVVLMRDPRSIRPPHRTVMRAHNVRYICTAPLR